MWKTGAWAAAGLVLFGVAVHTAGPLMIVAPAAPGGGWDQTARALQHAFAVVEPGTSVQVDNVPGAAGTIGLARFVTAERGNPDALIITGLVMVSGIITNHAPVTLSETTPIARLTGETEVIVVPAASPLRTLADLLTAFKASPTSVSWGGGSAGGTDDLLVRLVAEAVGMSPARVNYIAFPGGGAALAALLGGQITAGVSGYGEFSGQIAAGALRPLAISAPARIEGLDVPTLREQGVALDVSNWRGIVAPPGLTNPERDALTARIERVATSDAWRDLLRRNGWEDALLTGAAFRQFLLAEQQRVDTVLRRLESSAGANTTAGGGSPKPLTWLTPTTGPMVVLTLLGVLVMATFARLRSAPHPQGGGRRALLLIVSLSAHALAFPVVGFVPASTGLFVITTALFGSRRWRRDSAIGLVTAIVLYVLFTSGLGLSLPADPVARWLRG